MKVIGLDKATFLGAVQEVATETGMSLAWKDGQYGKADGSLDGYLVAYHPSPTGKAGYAHAPTTPWGQPEQGAKGQNKPCAHVVARVVRAAFLKAQGWPTIYAEKNKCGKGMSYQTIMGKVRVSMVKKGLGCHCEALGTPWQANAKAAGTISASPAQAQAAPQVAKAKPQVATVPFTAPPLDVDPILDGEGTKDDILKGTHRDAFAAVNGLYILQEVKLGLIHRGQAECAKRAKADPSAKVLWEGVSGMIGQEASRATALAHVWPDRGGMIHAFLAFTAEYEATLARNMFDYLTFACVGEMRHAGALHWQDGGRPQHRTEAYAKALECDPRNLLPLACKTFTTKGWWHGGFGGQKWANCANGGALYFKFRTMPVVFADHVVDLAHNGALVWDKGYHFYLAKTENVAFLAMLDRKRKGSLLEWAGQTLRVEQPVLDMIYPLLGLLKPTYVYQSDIDQWNKWRDHSAKAPDLKAFQAGKATEAERTVAWHMWRKAWRAWVAEGEAQGLTLEAPGSELVIDQPGIRVMVNLQAVDYKRVPFLKWGTGTLTLTTKEQVVSDYATPEATPEPVATPQASKPVQGFTLHQPRKGQQGKVA